MADIVDWGDINKNDPQKKQSTIRRLKLTSVDGVAKEYIVRFVGQPLEFYRYYANGKYAIVDDPVENPFRKISGLEPQKRFAINVLLRATIYNEERKEDGQVYMTDLPVSALRPVSAWARARKNKEGQFADPGGKAGPDFSITVTGTKGDTRFEVVALDPTPFTDEEKTYLRANAYDLKKFYKPLPNENLLEHLGAKTQAPVEKEPVKEENREGVELPF